MPSPQMQAKLEKKSLPDRPKDRAVEPRQKRRDSLLALAKEKGVDDRDRDWLVRELALDLASTYPDWGLTNKTLDESENTKEA